MNESQPILIVGAAGQVGLELQRAFAGYGPILAVDRESIDLADAGQIRELVRSTKPRMILNAAAYTAVDRAESEPALAHAINADAPGILADEARRLDALFVHYSTDYVFDGSKKEPWNEEDAPNPMSVYGRTKLAGEEAVKSAGGRYLILRTSWVYGPHGQNFLFTMLRLARERERLSVVDDQFGAPTTSIELAQATRAVVGGLVGGKSGDGKQWAGLYHMTCSGETTWYGFARAIFERAGKLLAGKCPEIIPVATGEYPTPAKRPRNSVLSNAKLYERFGVRLAAWETALDAVFQALEANDGGV
jgi:dTDP-4-dehydrorhamnose reductase